MGFFKNTRQLLLLSNHIIRCLLVPRVLSNVNNTFLSTNARITELISSITMLTVSVTEKFSAEFLTGILTTIVFPDGSAHYIVMCECVPIVVKNRVDLNCLDRLKCKTCIEIANQLFDIIEKLTPPQERELQELLRDHTLVVAMKDRCYRRVDNDDPSLCILAIRDNATNKPSEDPQMWHTFASLGLKQPPRYSMTTILNHIRTVQLASEALPSTRNRPTDEALE